MKEYKHRLNKGICEGLLKLYNRQDRCKLGDLGLTNSQYSNFQKLQYWKLAERVESEDECGGIWQITQRGIDFVEGGEELAQATTYRKVVVAFSEDTVTMETVIGKYDYRPWYSRTARAAGEGRQSVMF